MKKTWNVILKLIIAVASAVAGCDWWTDNDVLSDRI